MSGFSKYSVLAAALFLFLAMGRVNATVTVPNGIVAYVPVVITNYQTVTTPVGFQQNITLDAGAFQRYELPGLQNTEFFYANGTVLTSWLEGNYLDEGQTSDLYTSNTIMYWVSLVPQLASGDGDVTIYLGFAGNVSTSENTLMNGTIVGEAPQLSSAYGQYDNGASVFNFYSNFEGNTLPAGMMEQNSSNSSISVDNGITFNTASGSDYVWVQSANALSEPRIVESLATTGISDSTLTYRTGESTNDSLRSGGNYPDDYAEDTNVGLRMVGDQPGEGYTLTQKSFSFAPWDLFSFGWTGASEQVAFVNYTEELSSFYNDIPISSYYLYWGLAAAENASTYSVQWVRSRDALPGAGMPAAAFDTADMVGPLYSGRATPASPAVDSGQQVTLTANPQLGTAPYSYEWYSTTSSATAATSCGSGWGSAVGTSSTYATGALTSNTYYCYRVTDSSSPAATANSTADLVEVVPALASGPAPALNATSFTYPGSPQLTFAFYNGIAPYSCRADVSNATTGAEVASFNFSSCTSGTPMNLGSVSAGAYKANVIVTDHSGYLVNSTRSAEFSVSKATPSINITVPSNFTYDGNGGRVMVSVLPASANAVVTLNGASEAPVENGTFVGTITGFNHPQGEVLSPDGRTLYVANYRYETVSIVNLSTEAVTGTIDADYGCYNEGFEQIAISPNGNTLYVANNECDYVSVINVSTATELDEFSVPITPYGIAVSPDGGTLYVSGTHNSKVILLNSSTGSETGEITGFDYVQGIALSADGNTLYVANENNGTVSIVNATSGMITNTIFGLDEPSTPLLAPNGNRLYVTNEDNDTVSMISLANLSIIGTIQGYDGARGLAISRDGTSLYVVNHDNSTVTITSLADNNYDFVSPAAAGSYIVNATVAASANYTYAFATNSFSILPSPFAQAMSYAGALKEYNVSTQAGYGTYICAQGNWEPESESVSWTDDVSYGNDYSDIGHQTSNNCSISDTDDAALGIVGTNDAYTLLATSNFSSDSESFDVPYNLTAATSFPQSWLLLAVGCADYSCTSITAPPGCSQIVSENVNDNDNGTVWMAVCSQGAGSYNLSITSQDDDTYVSFAEYLFQPQARHHGASTTSTVTTTVATTSTATTSVSSTTVPTTTTVQQVNVTGQVQQTPQICIKGGSVKVNYLGLGSSFGVSGLKGCFTLFAVNATNSTQIPVVTNRTVLKVINITASNNNATLNATVGYPCEVPAAEVAPYILKNGGWKAITPFTVDAGACTVSFTIPADPTIALLRLSAYAAPTTTTVWTTVPTTLTTMAAQQQPQGGGNGYALAVVIIVVAAAAWALLRKRKEEQEAARQREGRKHSGGSRGR